MIRRWLALTYYLYALRLAALSHFYFNPLYISRRASAAILKQLKDTRRPVRGMAVLICDIKAA